MCSDKGLSMGFFSSPKTLLNITGTSGIQLKWGCPLQTKTGIWAPPPLNQEWQLLNSLLALPSQGKVFSPFSVFMLYQSICIMLYTHLTISLSRSVPWIRSSPEETQSRGHGKGGKEREPLDLLGRKEQEGSISPPLISSCHGKHQPPTEMHWNKFRGGYFIGEMMDKFLGDHQSRE